MNSFDKLMGEMENMNIVNTHSHHRDGGFFKTYNLDAILRNSYVAWSGLEFNESKSSREEFLQKVRYKHYFKSLEKAISVLYQLPNRITADNWDVFNETISKKNADFSGFDKLKDICHYEKIIIDTCWNPGIDHNRADIFAPTFRVDIFLYGHDRRFVNQDGVNISKYIPDEDMSIDEYVSMLYDIIKQKKRDGCVALKSANAYERPLNYFKATKNSAQLALSSRHGELSPEDVSSFQSYIFYCLCDIAAEFDMPFQIHTGLGQLYKTNAMQLYRAVSDHPKTKFVLFHCGFPWVEDIAALYHNFKNVYPDLCWISIISPTAAENILNQLLEVGTSDKICWGCDTWTFEESFGALQSVKALLAATLSKKVDAGYYTLEESKKLVNSILYNNAKALYKL